ncbi:MAG: hypothetical protein JWM10_4633 [Myxococcaceae bacterium]|nr:hypothetical protein [Myxococcaceae bacterium]
MGKLRCCVAGAALACGLGCGGAARPPVLADDRDVGSTTGVVDASGDASTSEVGADAGLARDAATADAGADISAFSIVGRWRNAATLPCVDEHTFGADGTYATSASTGERVSGSYRFAAGDGGARGLLTVTLAHDNGLPYCDGVTHNESGSTHAAFVAVEPGARRMTLYFSPTGDDVWFQLTRQ